MKNQEKVVGIVAALVCALGCSSYAARRPKVGPDRTAVQDAVQLAVERVLRNPAFRLSDEIPICVLDPAAKIDMDTLVKAIARIDPRVRSCEGSTIAHPTYVMIRSIQRADNGHLIINAGYFCGNLCADDWTLTLAVVGARWKIIDEKLSGIS